MADVITLALRGAPAGRIGADVIAPDRFQTLSNREIGGLPLWVSPALSNIGRAPRHVVALGEMFEIRGERASTVRLTGDLRMVDQLGAAMADGRLTIEGDAGNEVGRTMRGGAITVSGSVGADAGVAMAGGSLTVIGHAGERVGGPLPGASQGMTGGEIFVHGNAGGNTGAAVRRGLIFVGGDTADAGQGMIAGTLVVGGAIAGSVGLWNKRGSILSVGGATVPPMYQYACTYRPTYLRLLFRYLRARGVPIDERVITAPFARYCGDVSQVGKGELLLLADRPHR